jgi:hypothetical protein
VAATDRIRIWARCDIAHGLGCTSASPQLSKPYPCASHYDAHGMTTSEAPMLFPVCSYPHDPGNPVRDDLKCARCGGPSGTPSALCPVRVCDVPNNKATVAVQPMRSSVVPACCSMWGIWKHLPLRWARHRHLLFFFFGAHPQCVIPSSWHVGLSVAMDLGCWARHYVQLEHGEM